MTASSRYRNVGKGGEAYFVLEWNGSFGSHSGPSRGDSCRRASRPTEPFAVVARYVR
jgi:hypothetical protein